MNVEVFGLEWALGGIALTALVTTVGTWFVTRYQIRQEAKAQDAARRQELDRHGTFLAVRVTSVLDPFVMGCVAVVNDRGEYDPEGELNPDTHEPVLALPQEVDWKSVDPHLMDRILSLPNEIARAERHIALVGEMMSNPPDFEEWFDERRFQWGKIGLEAFNITEDLRKRYGLRRRDYSIFDPRETLQAAVLREEERRRKAALSAKRLAAKARKEQQEQLPKS